MKDSKISVSELSKIAGQDAKTALDYLSQALGISSPLELAGLIAYLVELVKNTGDHETEVKKYLKEIKDLTAQAAKDAEKLESLEVKNKDQGAEIKDLTAQIKKLSKP